MESVPLEMDDLFDDGALEDVDELALPPPAEFGDEPLNPDGDTQQDGEGEEQDESVLAKLKDLSKGAAKKRVMRPQPKLDASRLQGDRGIRVLPTLFDDVKFKGKNHEAEDLRLMMKRLEHWAHRLFPKMTFDQFIERMEKLGTKKEIQTSIKRIRFDLPFFDGNEEVLPQYDDDEDNALNKDPLTAQAENAATDMDAEEVFDEILREEAAKKKEKELDDFLDEDLEDLLCTPVPKTTPGVKNAMPSATDIPPTCTSTPTTLSASTSDGMTPEQRARMERNKRMAMEKRAARLGIPPTGSQESPGSGDKESNSQRNGLSQTETCHKNTDSEPNCQSKEKLLEKETDKCLKADTRDKDSKDQETKLADTDYQVENAKDKAEHSVSSSQTDADTRSSPNCQGQDFDSEQPMDHDGLEETTDNVLDLDNGVSK